jgi:hypothetical protein
MLMPVSPFDSPEPNLSERAPESVAALFALVQRQADDERVRGQGLDTKISTLAGFTGAILALTATLAKDVFGLRLAGGGKAAARLVFVLAITLLGCAAILAVWGAMRPRPRLVIDDKHLRQFTYSMLGASTTDIQGEMIETLFGILAHDRAVNDAKARVGLVAGIMLIGGLGGVAALAVVLAFGTS